MTTTTCPACGNEVPPGMPTCGWCGAALAGGADAGPVVLGVLALLGGLILLAGFPAVARRPDESSVARRAVRSYDGLRGRADATIESLAARASARREVARIGDEIAELETARANGLRQLGEAAYAQDEPEITRLRGEVASADRAIAAKRVGGASSCWRTPTSASRTRVSERSPPSKLQHEDEARTEVTPPAEDAADHDSERRAS